MFYRWPLLISLLLLVFFHASLIRLPPTLLLLHLFCATQIKYVCSRRPPTPRLRLNSEDLHPEQQTTTAMTGLVITDPIPVNNNNNKPKFHGHEEELSMVAEALGGETQDISDV